MSTTAGIQVQQMDVPGTGAGQVTAIPLILPDSHEFDPRSFTVKKTSDGRKSLYVVKEALQMIRGIQEPLSVLAICGPQRTGKSYVLSRVLGMPDAFELGHTMDPKTFGIWVGTRIVRTKDKRGKDCCILLIDTEGTDAIDATKQSDAGIFVLTVLLSSQLVYNSLNVPYKKDLDQLECFSKLADSIQIKSGAEVDINDNEHFPNFLWLLRDVSLIIPEDNNGCPMDATRYINEKVLRKGTSIKRSSHDDTAEAIRLLFPKIEAFTLPPPSANPKVMQNIAQHTKDLSQDFDDGVQQLVAKLIANCQQKLKPGYDKASFVTGEILASMIEEYVKAVNDPDKIPQMKSTWENVISRLVQETMDALVTKYRENMQGLITAASTVDGQQLPLEQSKAKGPGEECLLSIHKAVFDDVNNDLHTKIGHFGQAIIGQQNGFKQILQTFQDKLVQYQSRQIVSDVNNQNYNCKEICGGELWTFLENNRKLSKTYCVEVYMKLFQPIKDKIENDADNYTFDQMLQDMKQQQADYMDQARGPAKFEVMKRLDEQLGAAQKENLRKLKGYQEKVLEEKKKVKEREDEVRQRAEEVTRLKEDTEMMQQQHENNLQQMKQAFDQQMSQMQEEEKARRENDIVRVQELQAANMKEFANMIQESNKTNLEVFNKLMDQMQKNQREQSQQMVELIKACKTPPPVIVKKGGGGKCCIS